ncbi:MAG: PEP-CTERM sorting domain-containing protein [Verrucomicrobiae bacterium]|nr:PEP-CTERM sorting domain-containing protein [Verrucomicrobiae bacterium]MDW8345234.1 PEP-CTERM sorting domain-containing protein [Verrucomicrobiae bacterium]
MKTRIMTLVALGALLNGLPTHATLILNDIGGGMFTSNFATNAGSTAFAKDVIGVPPHSIANLNNGSYGNSSSWIGNSANTFSGISFGATPISIGSVAWGRDNTGSFTDRTKDTYELQYTTVPNPNASTPDSSWTTIGTVTYTTHGLPGGLASNSRRHEWSFTPVNATGIRLKNTANGTAIDELEVSGFIAPKLTLQATGGSFLANNLALAGTAFGYDSIPGHAIANINDGIYGNASSWIGYSGSSFVGVRLAASTTIDRIAFGRDNTGGFSDRAAGMYLIQYTTVASPDEFTPNSSWINLGAVYYDPTDPNRALRHLYSFNPVTATGIRIIPSFTYQYEGGGSFALAIDEIEIYALNAVPEPSTVFLIGVGGLFILRAYRRRQHSQSRAA